MATNRDAQTFLLKIKEKYPQYAQYDDATLMSKIKEKYPQYGDITPNTIPSSEGLLERSVKPFMSQSDVPKVAFQTAQGALGNLPQNIVENPLTTSLSGVPGVQAKFGAQISSGIKKLIMGGNAVEPETTEFSEKYLEPETVGGKILGTVGNIAGGSILPLIGAGKVAKSAIKGLDVGGAERNLSDVVYGGGKEVSSRIQDLFSSAKNKYKSVVDSADASKMTFQDIVDVLNDTIKNKKIDESLIRRPAEKALLSIRNKFASKIEEATPDIIEETIDPITNTVTKNIVSKGSEFKNPKLSQVSEIKNLKNEVFKSLMGEADLEGEFLKNFGLKLEDLGLSDIKEAGSAYRNAYSMIDEAKALRKPNLMRVAKGKVGPKELSEISSSEKKIGGLDVLKKSIEAGKKLSSAKRNAKIAGAGASAIGVASSVPILKYIFGNND